MLLTISCQAENATDLGYLLHKHPDRVFEANLWFGGLTVFYPEASAECCTAALLLNVDPVGLVRGGNRRSSGLDQYVNDRPYVASSLMSVALVEAFGTAMNGRSKERPERVAEKMPLRLRLAALNCGGGPELITRLFAPLGYTVTIEPAASISGDQVRTSGVPAEGSDALPVYTVTLEGMQTVQDALTHLYVLLPVLDNAKHYYIGPDEIEKLLAKGERWLPEHPEKALITRRYLGYRQAMVRQALSHLQPARDETAETQAETDERQEAQETEAETPLRLNEARLQAAMEAVLSVEPPAQRVLDLGCGEGNLLKRLLAERGLKEVVGVDVAAYTLERAAQRLRLESLSERQQERVKLLHGSLVYRDERFSGFDVALLIEVIEHLDPPRLTALEQVVFRHARPRRVIVTTPNAEYNIQWPSLPAGRFRHRDHRFEWTRAEFRAWAERVAQRENYAVTFRSVGAEDSEVGSPTQMAVFNCKKA